MIYSLKFYLASSVLISVGLYTILGFNRIRTKSDEFRNFMYELVASSIMIISMLIVALVRQVFFKGQKPTHILTIVGMFILLCVIAFTVSMFMAKHRQKKINTHNVMVLFGTNIIVLTLGLILENPRLIYKFSLFFYATCSLHLVAISFTPAYDKHRLGIYFMLFANMVVLISHVMYHVININLLLLITVSAQVLAVIGMMLYFASYHLGLLDESKAEVEHKNVELKTLFLELKESVYYDKITGFPNKHAYAEEIRLSRSYKTVALINIKNFMYINQKIGFSQGNEILKKMAMLIDEFMGDRGKVYRYDADQFLIKSALSIVEFEEAFADFRAMHKKIEEFYVDYYCSITKFDPKEDTLKVFNMIEFGVNKAKLQKSKIFYIDSDVYMTSKTALDIILKLREAISDHKFEMYYQPKYSLENEKIVSYEALIRWFDGDQSISPGVFIPIAEQEGLIDDISMIVISDVFKNMMSNWHKKRSVSINLSVLQLIDYNFIDFIIEQAKEYSINPKEVIFEVTESMLDLNIEQVQASTMRLKSHGFKLSLDDFGSGASSLYRFAKLDFDEIKYDRSFVTEMARNEKVYTTFVKTVELFKSYDMTIVAEGIETKEQLELLKPLDIDQIQGYYYSRPLPLKEVIEIG